MVKVKIYFYINNRKSNNVLFLQWKKVKERQGEQLVSIMEFETRDEFLIQT